MYFTGTLLIIIIFDSCCQQVSAITAGVQVAMGNHDLFSEAVVKEKLKNLCHNHRNTKACKTRILEDMAIFKGVPTGARMGIVDKMYGE